MNVTQMYKGPVHKKVLMPLFHIILPKQFEVDRIFQLTAFMGTEVEFEIYRGNKGPSQCFCCQGFWHSALACNLPYRCVKCAGAHSSKDYQKPFDDPCKCMHCEGDHPANYRACPKFPKAGKNSAKKANNNQKTSLQRKSHLAALLWQSLKINESSPPPVLKILFRQPRIQRMNF